MIQVTVPLKFMLAVLLTSFQHGIVQLIVDLSSFVQSRHHSWISVGRWHRIFCDWNYIAFH